MRVIPGMQVAEILAVCEILRIQQKCSSVADVKWKFRLLRVAAVLAVMLFQSRCYCQYTF